MEEYMSKSIKTKAKVALEDIESGKRLRSLREKRGVSRGKLGAYLNVSYQQIQKYESGFNRLSGKTLYEISRYFRVPMEFFYDKTYKLDDKKLSVKAMVNLGSTEFKNIEESFNRQFYKHIDWMYEAIEAGIRFNHDQATANAHYMDIRRVSTKRIILMVNKIVKQSGKAINDD